MKDIIKFPNYAEESFQKNSQRSSAIATLKNIILDDISQPSNYPL